MTVSTYISSLVQYGVNCGLIEECDRTYITNQLLQALCLDSCEPAAPAEMPLEEILKGLLDDAVAGAYAMTISPAGICWIPNLWEF